MIMPHPHRRHDHRKRRADPRLFIKPNKPHRMRENPWNEHCQQDDYTGGHDETTLGITHEIPANCTCLTGCIRNPSAPHFEQAAPDYRSRFLYFSYESNHNTSITIANPTWKMPQHWNTGAANCEHHQQFDSQDIIAILIIIPYIQV